MEALAAQVTADFAASNSNHRNRSRRGKPKPVAGPSQTPPGEPSEHASGVAVQHNHPIPGSTPNRGRGPRRRPRNGPPGASSTASSDNEHAAINGVADLPAPATQTSQPQRQARGQRYRSQLSEPATGPSRSTSNAGGSSRHAAPTEEELEHLSYRERLTAQLNTSSIDCPICINNIHRKQPIASCQTCSAPYHLKCLRDWAERSIAQVKEKAAMLANQPRVQIRAHWRCPSCQTQYPEDAKPKAYWCFCGRIKDPQGSPLSNAHSCEQSCKKPRPEGCNHPCPLLCHPGTCDPCNVMLRMRCHCGHEEKTIKCGTLHPQTAAEARIDVDEFLSCGDTCGRMLPCGLHKCQKTCHKGDCGDCETVRDKKCYCGRESTSTLCGGANEAQKRHECAGPKDGEKWIGEFACDHPCPWTYDCGKHTEAELSSATCHPHTSSEPLPCPRTPAFVTTCPCGKKALQDLPASPRKACTDSISTCGGICGKARNNCGHRCNAVCHEGPCPPCEEQVTLVCRCGNDKKTTKCRNISAEDANEFYCERICRALRACGRHECGRKCCPLAYQEANKKQRRRPLPMDNDDPLGFHICDRVCGRKLNCGQHNCEQPDHRGPCPPCLRSSFEEISCNCGSTVLMPPVPCSTRIQCNQPCARPDPPCGHSKPAHTCHEDDVLCPPCPFLTEKQCMCGSSSVKNVRCSQATVSCGKTCGKLLKCGYHRCKKMCHLPGECEDCAQTCGKPKSICGHPCQKKCHAPTKCSQDEPCAELVEATCPCGNIKQRARCGACTSTPTSNGGQKLSCTPACAVAQRNAALAEAFGISKDRQAGQSQPTAWSQDTLTFYGENMTWAKHIEQTFIEFVNSSRATHLFSPMKYPQRQFIHELASKFKLRSESLDEEPFRSVLIAKKADSVAPKPSLTEAWVSTFKQSGTSTPTLPPKRTLLTQPQKVAQPPQAAAPARPDVNSLYLEACFGYDAESLKEVIRPAMSGLDFELLWVNDEDVVCLVKASHVSASDLTLKLRLLRTSLRHKIANCKSVDCAWYDISQRAVTYREQSWTAVSGVRTPASSTFTSSTGPGVEASNAFSRLSFGNNNNGSRTPASANMSASNSASGGGQSNTVLSSGLYRPPRAIIVNGSKDADESVVENWEDAA